ncbi:MAG: helix-turn-helix transcriptional regulator [Rhodospirillales bacterium]|nr:helix-turn-helix transcriptional regulator [Rhodospirillales bacterium]
MLCVALEEVGGQTELRLDAPEPGTGPRLRTRTAPPQHLSLLPVGTAAWEVSAGIRRFRGIQFRFDFARARRQWGARGAPAANGPRLMFRDDRIWRCADLIAHECGVQGGAHGLYVEGLITALMTALFEHLGQHATPSGTAGLAPWQLRRVVEHLEQHAFEAIRLADLAALAGLSTSYFTRAFKSSTGLPPHRWQTRLRIAHAQRMLVEGERPLTDVALTTGFADQSHFTRVFRAQTGVTPGRWRREQVGLPALDRDRDGTAALVHDGQDRSSRLRAHSV